MDKHTSDAQLFFPYYKLDRERSDIGLHEYELAAKALEADQKSTSIAAGIVVLFSGALTTLLGAGGGDLNELTKVQRALGSTEAGLWVAIAIFAVAVLAARYFAGLQRSATYAARKIVVLRRLLGLDYGRVESVLPTNRLDGANEPYSIRMFPGWRSLQALPVIVVALVASAALCLTALSFAKVDAESKIIQIGSIYSYTYFSCIVIFLTSFITVTSLYRLSLIDDFESIRLLFARLVGGIIGAPVKKNIGYALYRLKLSIYEARRLDVKLSSLYEILILIEDKRYYSHNGNSYYDFASALIRSVKYSKLFGGSTIYQQLARTNFLVSLRPPIQRKVLEWLLAPWLNQCFDKKEGLDAYLCSVRFDRDVFGISAAIPHFFPQHPLDQPLEAWQRFLLVERLSNVSGTYPVRRIATLAGSAVSQRCLAISDVGHLEDAYQRLGSEGKITVPRDVVSLSELVTQDMLSNAGEA